MKKIPLTQGLEALVDDEDFERLNQHKWYVHRIRKRGNVVYARRHSPTANGRSTTIYMHRQILDAPPGSEVDHIDHNTLDNRRSNIRVTDTQGNQGNWKLGSTNTSGLKGVNLHCQNKRWLARIWLDGKRKHLGYFDTACEAALAYDAAVLKYRDEYATTNRTLGLLPEYGS